LRHYLACQTGQANMARAAFSPIACSWSRIDRRRNIMERTLFGAAGVEETHHTQSSHYFLRFKALPLAGMSSVAGKPVVARFDGGQLSVQAWLTNRGS
jgi:hypothetical protein